MPKVANSFIGQSIFMLVILVCPQDIVGPVLNILKNKNDDFCAELSMLV